jgi:hypothetical protein
MLAGICGRVRTAGLQGLHQLDDLEVRHLDLAVLAGGKVGLGDEHTLCTRGNCERRGRAWCERVGRTHP